MKKKLVSIILIILMVVSAMLFTVSAVNAGDTFVSEGLLYKITEVGTSKKAAVIGLDDTALKKVVIPDTVEYEQTTWAVGSIAANAFGSNTDVTEVTVGSNVQSIGSSAFSGCTSLKAITVSESNTSFSSVSGVLFDKARKKVIVYPSALTELVIPESMTRVGKDTFKNIAAIKKVTVEEGVESIDDYAFSSCSALEEVILPDSVTVIGNDTFKDSSSLKKIRLGNKIEILDSTTFSGCSSLEEIEIPDSVTTLKNGCFKGCSSLKKVTVGEKIETLGTDVFKNCGTLEEMVIGANVIPANMAKGITALKKVTLSEGTVMISDNAFNGCKNLEQIVIPDSVAAIAPSAFANCQKLPQATLDKIKEINSRTEVVIPGEAKRIGAAVFSGRTDLKKVVIGNGVEVIEAKAFEGCKALEKVNLPDSIYLISTTAFSGCSFYNTTKDISASSGVSLSFDRYNAPLPDYKGTRHGEMLEAKAQGYTGSGDIYYAVSVTGKVGSFKSADTLVSGEGIAADNYYCRSPYFASASNVDTDGNITQLRAYEFSDDGKINLLRSISVSLGKLDNKKALDSHRVLMYKGEEMTISRILSRAGVIHVQCASSYFENITPVDDHSDKIELTGKGINAKFKAMDVTQDYCAFTFSFYCNGCNYHATEGSANRPLSDLRLYIKVIEDASAEGISPEKIKIKNFDPDLTYRIDDKTADENGIIGGLEEKTTYRISVMGLNGGVTSIEAATLAKIDLTKDDFEILPPEDAFCSADEKTAAVLPGSAVTRKDPAVTIDTVSYYDKATGERIAGAPKVHGTYIVMASTKAETEWYRKSDEIVIGEFTVGGELTLKDGSAALCVSDGYKACYQCDICKKYYEDAEAKKSISDYEAWKTDGGKEAALGHDYGEATYTWDGLVCTATRICTRNDTHRETEIGTVEKTVTQNRSCTLDELSTCTATFTNKAFVAQTKTIKTADKTGHSAEYRPVSSCGGQLENGTCRWDCFECDHGCGDCYTVLTVYAGDENGEPVKGAVVKMTGKGTDETVVSGEDGSCTFVSKLKEGTYGIDIGFTDADGAEYTASGSIMIGGKSVTGSLGYLTKKEITQPEKTKETDPYICKWCAINERYRSVPIVSWIVSFVHIFIHLSVVIKHTV